MITRKEVTEMGKFYMTYARERPKDIVPYAESNDIGLMTNAAHRWSDSNEFLDMWEYDTERIVDSGGYNVQSKYGEYPWNIADYHYWLKSNKDKFEWAACMDYACEERFDDNFTVRERMDMTVMNIVEHMEYEPEYKLLPVLQGREIQDWVESYERLVERGIDVSHVGLGTVCRVSNTSRIIEIEKGIREKCGRIEKIHGFGVKVNAYKKGATFDTADSQAWVYAASNGECYRDKGDKLKRIPMGDDSRKRTVESFKEYYSYVSRLMGGKDE